jgi:hypothetical protein
MRRTNNEVEHDLCLGGKMNSYESMLKLSRVDARLVD